MGLFDFLDYGFLNKFSGSDKFAPYLLIATIFVAVISYLLGSLNGATIISTYVLHDDVRNHGSKNAGMTNMIRVFGKKAGVLTVLIDCGKTIVAVFIACLIGRITFLPYIAGLCCLIGHAYPCFFKFKGGKGVIVGATVMLCMSVPTFVCCIIIFVGVLLFTKYVSVASMVAAITYPFILDRINTLFTSIYAEKELVYYHPQFDTLIAFVIACMIIFLHRANIRRLKYGEESKIGSKKKDGENDVR